MKMNDMKKKSAEELKKLVAEQEATLREFRFGMAGSGKQNVATPRTARKTIARAKTILTEMNQETK